MKNTSIAEIETTLNSVAPNVQSFLARVNDHEGSYQESLDACRLFLDPTSVIPECKAAHDAILAWHRAHNSEITYQYAARHLSVYDELPADLNLI